MIRALRLLHLLGAAMVLLGIAGVLSVMAVTLAPVYGPEIERLIYPVIGPSDRTTITRSGDDIIVHLWADKLRPCRFVMDSAAFLVGSDAAGWRRAWYSRPGNKPGPSRPEGLQDFGLWAFPSVHPGEQIVGIWQYRCHDGWLTPANLGPWVAP